MSKLGEPIAVGSRSVVHAWGRDAVAKVPLASTPEGWIRFEAGYTDAVFYCGAPVPRVLGIEVIEGRDVSIFERIDGLTMWDELMQRESEAVAYGRQLGEVHASLFALLPPVTLPTRSARLISKITMATREIDDSLSPLLKLLPRTPELMKLCHGDFHPKNILMSTRGPVVVDWFDASRGDPCGDVARTSLLLTAERENGDRPKHLPGATPHVLDELHDSYLETVRRYVAFSDDDLVQCRIIEAAARLAEGMVTAPLTSVLVESNVRSRYHFDLHK